jgi:hypothetical protein
VFHDCNGIGIVCGHPYWVGIMLCDCNGTGIVLCDQKGWEFFNIMGLKYLCDGNGSETVCNGTGIFFEILMELELGCVSLMGMKLCCVYEIGLDLCCVNLMGLKLYCVSLMRLELCCVIVIGHRFFCVTVIVLEFCFVT